MIFKPGQFKNFLSEMKRLSKTTNFRQPLNKNLNAILAFLHSYQIFMLQSSSCLKGDNP